LQFLRERTTHKPQACQLWSQSYLPIQFPNRLYGLLPGSLLHESQRLCQTLLIWPWVCYRTHP